MSTKAASTTANATASPGTSNATASATNTVNVIPTPAPVTVYPPPSPPSSSSDSPPTSSPPLSKLTGVYMGITVGAVVIILVLIILCIYCWKKKVVPKGDSYGGRLGHQQLPKPPPSPPTAGSHLVSLAGYCIAGERQPTVDWPTRLKIAFGVAKGLAYLHEECLPKIIHRDIKSANILLDFNFETKVADFGLARFCPDINTHISTRVMGTIGYLAPEYATSGKLTEKSDVFSFGVILLELITGRTPVQLVESARPLLPNALKDENFDRLVDPRLQNEYNPNEMARMVTCAAASIQYSAMRRPNMSEIVSALKGDSTVRISPGGLDYDTAKYKEEMTMFLRNHSK